MIHTKITNVLLFLIIVSLWFLAYTQIQLQIDMQNYKIKQELTALKQELSDKKFKQQNDLIQPELEPEPIKFQDVQTLVDIPGVFTDPRKKVRHGN